MLNVNNRSHCHGKGDEEPFSPFVETASGHCLKPQYPLESCWVCLYPSKRIEGVLGSGGVLQDLQCLTTRYFCPWSDFRF